MDHRQELQQLQVDHREELQKLHAKIGGFLPSTVALKPLNYGRKDDSLNGKESGVHQLRLVVCPMI